MTFGFIYKLHCVDADFPEVYVGSTENLTERKHTHSKLSTDTDESHHQLKLYKYIRTSGGFDKWSMTVIENVEFENHDDLLWRERFHIEDLKSTLNVLIPIRSEDERKALKKQTDRAYYEAHREAIQAQHKEYEAAHSEHLAQKKKEYRENNADYLKDYFKDHYELNKSRILAQHKEYRDAHKEQDKAAQQAWREKNKERIAERKAQPIVCECGITYKRDHAAAHRRSKKHINTLAALNPQ